MLTDLYTCASAFGTSVSTIMCCNQNNYPVNVRISVAVAGAADEAKQYILYDAPIQPRDSLAFTIGIALANTDKVRIQASSTGVSFNLFGVEFS